MRAPTAQQQARRDSGPATDRGAAKRRELLQAARRVFETKGFIDTRIADIAKEAGVSHGSFYTYFETKESVFAEVAIDAIESMHAELEVWSPSADLGDRLHDSVRRFLHAYRPHAAMLGLMEQVGTYSPEMRELRLQARVSFIDRTVRGLERMKADGRADPALDVQYAAEALGAMLEYVSYLWFCLDKDFDEDRMVDILATIWQRSIEVPKSRRTRP